jgi:16S rRNA (adenine1518-N6/adenine1519-N6)-dimethyltransferase
MPLALAAAPIWCAGCAMPDVGSATTEEPMSPRRRSSVPSRRKGGKPKPRPRPPAEGDVPEYLRRLGISPRKALGQHFLIDEFVLGDIARALEPAAGEVVLEIGAGPGALTEELMSLGVPVVAVELDEELAAATRARLVEHDHLEIVAADILEWDPEELLEEAGMAPPYVACGNLPYYITQPIVRKLLEAEAPPRRIVVMVQREVGQRMVGGPGRESLLSMSVQLYGAARVLFEVPPSAFWPPPKVHSAVVRIDLFPRPAVDLGDDEIEAFFHLLRAGFAQPRKQIHNVLPEVLGLPHGAIEAAIIAAGLDPVSRAQHLALGDWERLYVMLRERHPEALVVE